ncbi:hypothetical protein A2635_03625 [Candidatus Peribacteria bacterium RIFCSPHIGHO2_01_FULL_51_9]|nr:MAG: hypothetical protein A2635_03625 [Candidatus Peribacteria bacterium RIFCSPHIGHO2_01_FULL_51_9]HLC66305.1 hypothetical protein [Candidatus Nanoarchaeia archaeon]
MDQLRPAFQRLVGLLSSRTAVYGLFIILLFGGIAIAKDYGISWDEKAMYVLGEEAYEYIVKGEAYPTSPSIRFHGAWFEVLQYFVQEVLQLRFARSIFMMRHMMNYVTFWIGMLAIYGIALHTFRSRPWALVAVLMMLLSPRQFGHAFFNGRDIPAMAFFTLKMFTLLLFIERPSPKHAFLHGIASGLVIATRVGLLFLPLYTVLFLALRMLSDVVTLKTVDWKRYGILFMIYGCTFCIATVVFWPLLWEHPILSALEALKNMLWEQQDSGGFYFGENIDYLPWHWVPVHIISKTPLLYVTFALLAVMMLIFETCRRPSALLKEQRNTFLFFLWFILPIFTVIALHATLFDEWRHLYFIYPALILLAITGIRGLLRYSVHLHARIKTLLQAGILIFVVGSFLQTAIWMVRNHPLQYVYFSLPSQWVEGRFELDYWGLSFRQGLEWILAHDEGDPISVTVTSSPGWEALNILTQEQRQRLLIRRQFDTKYILDNFRWKQYVRNIPDEYKVHSIYVSGMEVLGIYRNPDWAPEADRAQPRMEDFEVQMYFNPVDKGMWGT